MSTDRELLELAAKSAGIYLEWDGHPDQWQPMYYEGKTYHSWNPLTDDGDALRLAVKLKIDISFFEGYQQVLSSTYCYEHESLIDYSDDRAEDVRLAIVTVAASVGRSMP